VKLSRLLMMLAAVPALLIMVAGAWLLTAQRTDAQRILQDQYGQTVARTVASLVAPHGPVPDRMTLQRALSPTAQRLPGLVAVGLHDAAGNDLVTVEFGATREAVPYFADLRPGEAGGYVKVMLSKTGATELGPPPDHGRLVSFMVLSAVVLFLTLGVAQAGQKSIAALRAVLRRLANREQEGAFADTLLGEDDELVSAVNELAALTAQRDAAGRDEAERMVVEARAALQAVERREAEVRSLFARINEEVERDRRAIAVDIHDQINASAIALRTSAQSIAKLSSQVPIEEPQRVRISEQARTISASVDEIYTRARHIVRNLRPEMLEMLGLSASLAQLLRQMEELQPQCTFDLDERVSLDFLDADSALVVYRIVQEALNNVVKHAGATAVHLVVEAGDAGESVSLAIRDNGCGFERDADAPSTLGLVGMRERAASVGAELSISSQKGVGTTVWLRFQRRPV